MITKPIFQTGGNFGSPKLDLGGCVLYLPLWRQDQTGSPFNSKSVYGIPSYACTVVGATWGTTGRYFDGSDDNIDCGGTIPDVLTNQLSLEMWVYTTGLVTSTFWCAQGQPTAAGYDWGFYNTGSKTTQFYVINAAGTGNPCAGGTVLVTSKWYHLLGTYDGAYLNIYVNGVSDGAAVAQTGNARDSGYNFIIGKWNSTLINAIVGEVRVFNRCLSAAEVLHNYQATKWKFI